MKAMHDAETPKEASRHNTDPPPHPSDEQESADLLSSPSATRSYTIDLEKLVEIDVNACVFYSVVRCSLISDLSIYIVGTDSLRNASAWGRISPQIPLPDLFCPLWLLLDRYY